MFGAASALNWLGRRYGWLRPELARAALIRVFGLGYAALVAVLLWQALRGQSLIHPDGAILLAMTATASAVIVASGYVCWSAQRRHAVFAPGAERLAPGPAAGNLAHVRRIRDRSPVPFAPFASGRTSLVAALPTRTINVFVMRTAGGTSTCGTASRLAA
jgi:hypothetical protein